MSDDSELLDSTASEQISDERAAECWRAVGHRVVRHRFANARWKVDDALWPIEEALRDDRAVDEAAVREARRQIDTLQHVLEDVIVPITDGVEPWDDGAGSTIPYGVMADHLESSGGYDVERPSINDSADRLNAGE
jgi:hypothetical protein